MTDNAAAVRTVQVFAWRKLTIAQQFGCIAGCTVFHNHLIVDAVAAVFPSVAMGDGPLQPDQVLRLRPRKSSNKTGAQLRPAVQRGVDAVHACHPEAETR